MIPAYCAGKYLERTLVSVLAQTHRNIEVLVVNDGSTDSTYEVASRMAALDQRIKLFNQQNNGVAAARNYAINQARGQYIAPLDADDIWQPTHLAKLISKLEDAGSDVGVVYSWSKHIGENDSALSGAHAYTIEGDVFSTMVCHYFLGNASCTLIRSECLDDVGLYSTEFRAQGATGCEDWDLYLRIARKYKFKVVPEFLVGYRKVSDGISQRCEEMARAHGLVLANAQRFDRIPKVLLSLSRSSFYIYLAYQSAMYGRAEEARSWIVRAAQAELLTTLMRIDVYPLMLRLPVGPSVNSQTSILATSRLRLLAGVVLHRTLTAMYPGRVSLKTARGNLGHHPVVESSVAST